MITNPEELSRGDEVWVFVRRWYRGRITRIIEVNAKLAHRGCYHGNRAVVLYQSNEGIHFTVRRPCVELIPAALVADAPYMPVGLCTRALAIEVALEWWRKYRPIKSVVEAS